MTKNNFSKKIPKAFTLLELSVVIVVISILVTGALSISISNVNNNKTKITNDRIKEIYKAMGRFLLANKRLPCPASILKIKITDSTYGAEVNTGAFCGTGASSAANTGVYAGTSNGSNLAYGMVPAATLGLPSEMAEDGFGTRFAYIIHKDSTVVCASPANFSNNTFCTSGPENTYANQASNTIIVNEKPSASVTLTPTSSNPAIFAIVSYGANKFGGFNSSSTTQNTRSSDADEYENDAGLQSSFNNAANVNSAAFDNVLIAYSASVDGFDDIVFYKSRNDMVQEFNALSLIPCKSGSDASLYGGVTFSWPVANYDQAVLSTTLCSAAAGYDNSATYPVKRCGPYGIWGPVVVACT